MLFLSRHADVAGAGHSGHDIGWPAFTFVLLLDIRSEANGRRLAPDNLSADTSPISEDYNPNAMPSFLVMSAKISASQLMRHVDANASWLAALHQTHAKLIPPIVAADIATRDGLLHRLTFNTCPM